VNDPIHNHEEFVEAIQGASEIDDAVLVSYALVCEWVDTDGKRWLTRIDASASGSRLSEWTRQGMLFNALHTAWNDDSTEED